jgi:predicted transposase/invertase (TIGR01784 family)
MRQLVRFDWAMKKLLRSKTNFGILEGFLSELLGRDLKILELLESESNKETEEEKYNKVDILVKLDNGEIVLIEVQVNTEFDYFHRMLFGTSKIISEHMKAGQTYSHVKKVYSVNIIYFDLGHGSDYIYHGTTSFTGMHNHDELDLNEKQKELYQKKYIHQIYPEYYLIKVNQFNDVAKSTLDEWIYFLKNEEVKDGFHAKGLLEAKEKLDTFKLPEQEKHDYDKFVENLRYKESMAESTFESGKIEGEKVKAIEIAKKMKAANTANELIQQFTGLSTNEINKL